MTSRSLRRKPSPFRVQEERTGWFLIAPFVFYVIVVFVLPVLFLMFFSVFRWSLAEEVPQFSGWAIIRAALTDRVFWMSLRNSAVFMLLSVPSTIIMALLVGLLLSSRSPLRWKGLFKAAYFLPFVTSLAATAFIWTWIFNPSYGLLNDLLGRVGLPGLAWLSDTTQVLPALAIMYVWVRLGFDMAILLAGLENIPTEYYEAATIDGAHAWQSFRHITFPLLNPQLVVVGVLEVVNSLRTFDLPYVATKGGPLNASRTVVLHIYDTAFTYDGFSKASASALLLFILILAITVVQIRLTSRKVDY